MKVTVVYGRHGVTHEKDFDDLPSAVEWVEKSEDRDEIWAAAVLVDDELIFDHEHPPSDKRWKQLTSVPWPGKHP